MRERMYTRLIPFIYFYHSCPQRNELIIIHVGYESLTYNVVQQKSAYDVQDFFGEFFIKIVDRP